MPRSTRCDPHAAIHTLRSTSVFTLFKEIALRTPLTQEILERKGWMKSSDRWNCFACCVWIVELRIVLVLKYLYKPSCLWPKVACSTFTAVAFVLFAFAFKVFLPSLSIEVLLAHSAFVAGDSRHTANRSLVASDFERHDAFWMFLLNVPDEHCSGQVLLTISCEHWNSLHRNPLQSAPCNSTDKFRS